MQPEPGKAEVTRQVLRKVHFRIVKHVPPERNLHHQIVLNDVYPHGNGVEEAQVKELHLEQAFTTPQSTVRSEADLAIIVVAYAFELFGWPGRRRLKGLLSRFPGDLFDLGEPKGRRNIFRHGGR
jgi:hypothetical protein